MIQVNTKKIERKTLIDKAVKGLFMAIAIMCAMIIVMITIFIIIKGLSPFIKKYNINGSYYRVSVSKFIFNNTWFRGPNIYGVGFIVLNTFYVTILSLLIAVPISVLTALFISKIAPRKISIILNAVIELLASIPSVIYGLFGVGVITRMVDGLANVFGLQTAGGQSTLSAVLVLAIMIIPTITMVSITSIKAVKNDLINGSLALGVSKMQTNFKVVLVSAKSGIFSGIILGVGRALGEATAVSMVCGNAISGPNFSLFGTTRILTSTMLLGLHESSGLDYDIRFSVGVVLILIILITNLGLNMLKNRIGNANGK